MKGYVIGFVRPVASGKWDAYLDFQKKAGSSLIAVCDSKQEAVRAVQRAAFG